MDECLERAGGSPWLCVIVLGEYRYGLLNSRRREEFSSRLTDLEADWPVLEIDLATVAHYAAVHEGLRRSGRPIPANDLWIAALCRQHGCPIVSRDAHFDQVPDILRLTW